MNATELKKEIVTKLESVTDEKLLAKVLDLLKARQGVSVKEIYKEVVEQYSETLKRLAQN